MLFNFHSFKCEQPQCQGLCCAIATSIHLRNAPHRVSDGQTFLGLAVGDVGVTIQVTSHSKGRFAAAVQHAVGVVGSGMDRWGWQGTPVLLVQGVGDHGHRHGHMGPTPLSL